jgi:hypothetical protein
MKSTDVASSEKTLWSWLVGAHLENDFGRDLHIERIENLVGVGNPDVTGCYRGGAFDLELKTAHRPARSTTAVIPIVAKDPYIRPAQKNWHMERWRAGGQCYFLVQVGRLSRYLLPGDLARDIEGKPEAWLYDRSVLELPGPLSGPLEIIRRASTYRSPS